MREKAIQDEVEETVPQVCIPGVDSLVNKYISKGI